MERQKEPSDQIYFESAQECIIDSIVSQILFQPHQKLNTNLFFLTQLLRVGFNKRSFLYNLLISKPENPNFRLNVSYQGELKSFANKFKDLESLSEALNVKINLIDDIEENSKVFSFNRFDTSFYVILKKLSQNSFMLEQSGFRPGVTEENRLIKLKQCAEEIQEIFLDKNLIEKKRLGRGFEDRMEDDGKRRTFAGEIKGSEIVLYTLQDMNGKFLKPSLHSMKSIEEKLNSPDFVKTEVRRIMIPTEFNLPTQRV